MCSTTYVGARHTWHTHRKHTNQGVTQAQSPFCSFLRTDSYTHTSEICVKCTYFTTLLHESVQSNTFHSFTGTDGSRTFDSNNNNKNIKATQKII